MSNRIFKPDGYEEGCRREWLVTNGLGGYASSTSIGANTRAYHGLLVAALDPPVNRCLLLSSLDEELISESHHYLACHQYPGVVYPQGFKDLLEFSLDPLPRFTYRLGDTRIEKSVFMIQGENTTIISYRITGGKGLFRVVPLITSRGFHSVAQPPEILQEAIPNGVRLRSSSDLFILSNIATYVKEELRYYNMEYEEERKRGLPWKEDLFSPGRFELELEGDVSLAIVASTWRDTMPDVQDCLAREMTRTRGLKAPVTDLAMAADSFLVKRGLGLSIIAGYHWFDDWGRDAMISLPGLLLTTGRYTEAKEVLTTFANHCRGGTLPNDLGAGSYNAADPSLWFLRALYSYYRYSEDRELVRQLWPVVTDIVDSYIQGNAVVKMDQDGLLVTEEGTTWMDARVDGVCVTPRRGKACEINALWYSALCISRALAKALRKRWEIDLEDKVKNSYQKFWNIEKGCLYDLIDPLDQSVRPNQVIAAAFAFDLLPIQQRKGIVETATLELLTPYGLRTLSPKEPGYIGRYEGNPQERDRAFHQGTVWPWLMGPYITAYMKANRRSMKTRQKAQELLRSLLEQDAPGIGSIPEVYDGDAPHRPGGCISQAWSVAEILRAWSEEGMGRKFEGSSC